MLSLSSSEQSTPSEVGNGDIGNMPTANGEPQASMQNVVRNLNGAISLMASSVSVAFEIHPTFGHHSYGTDPWSWYPNPFFANNPMFIGMPQLGT